MTQTRQNASDRDEEIGNEVHMILDKHDANKVEREKGRAIDR